MLENGSGLVTARGPNSKKQISNLCVSAPLRESTGEHEKARAEAQRRRGIDQIISYFFLQRVTTVIPKALS